MRGRLIARLAGYRPGRRGFGDTADPEEAAAFRRVVGGDRSLNPGMTPPSTALRPAAVLVPLIDAPDGMSVLLTQRTAASDRACRADFISRRPHRGGGRRCRAAALRETEEEVGLPREPSA